jgi:hypothetical protein
MSDETTPADLLRPSLTEADDASGFDRPWSPGPMVWIAFFAGLAPAGILLAINFRRLGMPAWFRPTLAATIVLALVLHGAFVYVVSSREWGFSERQWLRVGVRVISLAFASILVVLQNRRFELFRTTGQRQAPLLKPALLAIAGTSAVLFAYGAAIRELARP